MKKHKTLIISIAIPLLIGVVSGFLTMNSMNTYKELLLPKYAPPGYLFPIVWTILYILMGIASYLVYQSNDEDKNKVLLLYGMQLVMNFIWPILFFNLHAYLLSTVWLLLLFALVIIVTYLFFKINHIAGYLMIPYVLWLSFALYLNFNIFLLN